MFRSRAAHVILFKPGQFVTLELEIEGEKVMRSYTISSAPSLPYNFNITVKRAPGGVVSNWLHDNLNEGDQIVVHGPAGRFNCIDKPAEKALLLAGGVGITPIASMARWWFDTNADVDTVFVSCVRTPRDIIFKHQLEWMTTRLTNFQLNIVCEKIESGDVWSGYRGLLNVEMLKLMAPDVLDRQVYCCGPTPFMKAVRYILQGLGFPMENYHEESFGETPEGVSDQITHRLDEFEKQKDETESKGFAVRFSGIDTVSYLDSEQALHVATLKAGVGVPKACGVGVCGACKVKKIEGEIEMKHNGGISEEEIADGYLLSCCSFARSDVLLEVS
ncbi:hybrid-cluster NAD(P)-dependent oxidoreductase [Paenalcaligenes niemegkensis]|uniref:hybrid-cluster NAD(P)-dependent oxidoreductase n=1 Tax=Paenalcaligenes niemegkensis TaxID=2895469 RepID=UPI001EE7EC18|nr:hybrid-cluster NAD(P)-dependent oxidoreductase [Paenalcaligenes niemegkensis]MCQ9617668.1 hybrid-cluster NAD(P)-dependent oxidoreductase [Paenalcaligenes niemegkensis]